MNEKKKNFTTTKYAALSCKYKSDRNTCKQICEAEKLTGQYNLKQRQIHGTSQRRQKRKIVQKNVYVL